MQASDMLLVQNPDLVEQQSPQLGHAIEWCGIFVGLAPIETPFARRKIRFQATKLPKQRSPQLHVDVGLYAVSGACSPLQKAVLVEFAHQRPDLECLAVDRGQAEQG